MLWCVITSPVFYAGEDVFISRLVRHGVDIIHLRKPEACASDCARLLDRLTDQERSRITIHDFFELAGPYGLRVKRYKEECSYVFLSPVFDSISKQGYSAAFSPDTLFRASAEGIIDSKVFALGGVTPDKAGLLSTLGFGGAVMLGCVDAIAHMPEAEQDERLEEIRIKIKG